MPKLPGIPLLPDSVQELARRTEDLTPLEDLRYQQLLAEIRRRRDQGNHGLEQTLEPEEPTDPDYGRRAGELLD